MSTTGKWTPAKPKSSPPSTGGDSGGSTSGGSSNEAQPTPYNVSPALRADVRAEREAANVAAGVTSKSSGGGGSQPYVASSIKQGTPTQTDVQVAAARQTGAGPAGMTRGTATSSAVLSQQPGAETIPGSNILGATHTPRVKLSEPRDVLEGPGYPGSNILGATYTPKKRIIPTRAKRDRVDVGPLQSMPARNILGATYAPKKRIPGTEPRGDTGQGPIYPARNILGATYAPKKRIVPSLTKKEKVPFDAAAIKQRMTLGKKPDKVPSFKAPREQFRTGGGAAIVRGRGADPSVEHAHRVAELKKQQQVAKLERPGPFGMKAGDVKVGVDALPKYDLVDKIRFKLSMESEKAEQQAARSRAKGGTGVGYATKSFTIGMAAGAVGFYSAWLHPVRTAKGVYYAATHPMQTGARAGAAIKTRPAQVSGETTGAIMAGVGTGKLIGKSVQAVRKTKEVKVTGMTEHRTFSKGRTIPEAKGIAEVSKTYHRPKVKVTIGNRVYDVKSRVTTKQFRSDSGHVFDYTPKPITHIIKESVKGKHTRTIYGAGQHQIRARGTTERVSGVAITRTAIQLKKGKYARTDQASVFRGAKVVEKPGDLAVTTMTKKHVKTVEQLPKEAWQYKTRTLTTKMRKGGKAKMQMEIKKPLIDTKLAAKVERKPPSSLSVSAQARPKGKAVQRSLIHKPEKPPKTSYAETFKGKTYTVGTTPRRTMRTIARTAAGKVKAAPGKVAQAAKGVGAAAKKTRDAISRQNTKHYLRTWDAREKVAAKAAAIRAKVRQAMTRKRKGAAPPPKKGVDRVTVDKNQLEARRTGRYRDMTDDILAQQQLKPAKQMRKPGTLTRPGTPQPSIVLEQQRAAAQLAYVYRPVKFDIATGMIGAGFAVAGQAYKLQQEKQYPIFQQGPKQDVVPVGGQQPIEQHFHYYPADGTRQTPTTVTTTTTTPPAPPYYPPPGPPPILTPPGFGPPLTPPLLPKASMPPAGGWQSWARKFLKKEKQPKGYTPSATAMAFTIKGKASKVGTKTGLGLRPIVVKKKKKKNKGVMF